MKLPVEQFFATFFVGSLFVFVLLLLYFVIMGNGTTATIQYLFGKLVYKHGAASASSKHKKTVASFSDKHIPGTRDLDSVKGRNDPSKFFLGIVLFSMLFAFGVAIEGYSDVIFNDFKREVVWFPKLSPPEILFNNKFDHTKYIYGLRLIRVKAFTDIYNAENLGSIVGKFGPTQATINDAIECIDSSEKEWALSYYFRDNALYKYWSDKRIKDKKKKDKCEKLLDNVHQYFYHAKNKVYAVPNLFSELREISRRSNFLRCVFIILNLACCTLLLGAILKMFSSFVPSSPKKKNGFMMRVAQHWNQFSVAKLFIAVFLLWMFSFKIIECWELEEKAFDKRIYGYYLDNLADKDCYLFGGHAAISDCNQKELSSKSTDK